MKNVLRWLCLILIAQIAAAQPAPGCTGNLDPSGPVVCVDDTVTPPKLLLPGQDKPLRVQSMASNGHVYVTWKTISGGDLDLKFRPDVNTGKKCYKFQFFKKTCSGDTCRIKVNPDAAKGQCQYDLWVKGVLVDPVLIVEEWPLGPPLQQARPGKD